MITADSECGCRSLAVGLGNDGLNGRSLSFLRASAMDPCFDHAVTQFSDFLII